MTEGTIEPIFVSVEDAAKALSISKWSMYQLCDQRDENGDPYIETRYRGTRRLVVVESLRNYANNLPTERPRAGESA